MPVYPSKGTAKIVRVLFTLRDGHPVFNELKYISQVKRFSMTLMFFSEKEKSGNKLLFFQDFNYYH